MSNKNVGLIISPTTQLGVVKHLPMTTLNRRISKEATLDAVMLNLLTLQWCGKTDDVKVKVFISTCYKILSQACASNFNSYGNYQLKSVCMCIYMKMISKGAADSFYIRMFLYSI